MMVFLGLPQSAKKASHSRIETDNVDFGLVATSLILIRELLGIKQKLSTVVCAETSDFTTLHKFFTFIVL